MHNNAKIFANITEARRRMRVAAAAGCDLDEAGAYARVHGLAAIRRHDGEMDEDAGWWTSVDWHDEPRDESVEVGVGAWRQLRTLARPAETAALAHIARLADRLTHAEGRPPDAVAEVIETHIDLLKKRRHPDALDMWREGLAWVRTAERIIDRAEQEALGISPAARDHTWGRPPLWLKDPRRGSWYKNPDWTERVTSLAGRMRARLDK